MNIRDFLDRLRSEGVLITIDEELDPKFEVSAVLKLLGEKESPAVLFNSVKGYDIPIAGNLLDSERKVALALNVKRDVLWDEYQRRLAKPLPSFLVKEAPAQEVVVSEGIDILRTMPVLTYHEKDISPYITQGVVFVKDPDTGRTTMGVHRLQIKGDAKLGLYISIASVTSGKILENAKRRGQSLPVAIAIGVEPAILLASFSSSSMAVFNKLELAGGLNGAPIKVVKAKTIEMEVPADAMFIIEGEIPPDIKEKDGPFGEASGYYISGQSSIINVKAISHQKSPLYSVFQPFSRDSSFDAMYEFQLKGMLKQLVPGLVDIAYNFISNLLVLSIRKRKASDGRQALYSCLTVMPPAKYAIAVDEDVDVHNFQDVGFALAGRCQPDRDVIVINDVLGFDLDPSLKDGCLTSKIGLDATRPLDRQDRFEKIQVPKVCMEKAVEILKKYL